MKIKRKQNGMIMVLVVFIIAFMTVLVAGMLQNSGEDIQLMRNQISGAIALATAQAGLNDAFSELREDCDWDDGFSDKSYNNGSYDVEITGSSPNLTVVATGQSQQGYTAKIEADVTLSETSPYILRIDSFRINE
jgi:Tfp pilus assembly protein PilX